MIIAVGTDRYEIEPSTISNVEAIAIEEAVGLTLVEMAEALDRGSAKAITALVWIAWSRKDPTLSFESVKFHMGTVDVNPAEEGEAEAPKVDATDPPEQP